MTTYSAAGVIAAERTALVGTLNEAGPAAPTLCEGWQTRHLLAHLILRETQPLVAAGVMGGPLGKRTERLTNEYAQQLADPASYRLAVQKFADLPGYGGMRKRWPVADAAMNTLEYLVHTEDVRRAAGDLSPREVPAETQQKIWDDVRSRGRLLAGKSYPGGLILEAPGYSPSTATILGPKPGKVATVLSGQPAELVLYLFGRQDVAQVRKI